MHFYKGHNYTLTQVYVKTQEYTGMHSHTCLFNYMHQSNVHIHTQYTGSHAHIHVPTVPIHIHVHTCGSATVFIHMDRSTCALA